MRKAMELSDPVASDGISKWDIRQKIWDFMEANNLADFPRPVHHRIPNFKDASRASARLLDLQEFQRARTVKVNPDIPQKNARFLSLEGSFQLACSIQLWDMFNQAREVKVDPDKPLEGIRLAVLQARKTLLVPTPRLRTGLFNRIVPPPGATKETLRKCATSQGVREYSVPVGLDAKVQVDLVVVGSVAVSVKGWRIGKGEGYADMEYAMMVSMGAVREDTVVVTAVHDCQVVDIPEELLGDHDLTVDYILTPTRTIKTGCKHPKPQGILWYKVTQETLAKIPILRNLRYREKEEGKDVTLKNEQPDCPSGVKPTEKSRLGNAGSQNETREAQSGSEKETFSDEPGLSHTPATVYVGNIPQRARVSELKEALRACHATPMKLTWHGTKHQAFLSYADRSTADMAFAALQGLTLLDIPLRIEWAKGQANAGRQRANKGALKSKLQHSDKAGQDE